VILFLVRTGEPLSTEDAARLAAASIAVAPGVVKSIRFWNGRVTVRHGESETICDTVYSALGMHVHSELATNIGAAADELGYLNVDAHQQRPYRACTPPATWRPG
jgi:thioredoxin reductase (NADPH)